MTDADTVPVVVGPGHELRVGSRLVAQETVGPVGRLHGINRRLHKGFRRAVGKIDRANAIGLIHVLPV